ncbi:MAG: HK97 family phage prohead protease [Verrucomicrobiia bacterium]
MPEKSNRTAEFGFDLGRFEKSFVTLSNGERGLRAGLKIKANAAKADSVVEFIASDETLDRTGEIIRADGWQLENYKKNPVFQNSHQYGDIIFTIGKTEQIEVRTNPYGGSYLYQRVRFAVDENPIAKVAYELYRGGFLNAVSVGFRPVKWIEGEKALPARRIYIEQELIEVSAVSIPSNANALILAAKSGAINTDAIEESIQRVSGLIKLLNELIEKRRATPVYINSQKNSIFKKASPTRNKEEWADFHNIRLRAVSAAMKRAIEKIEKQCGKTK